MKQSLGICVYYSSTLLTGYCSILACAADMQRKRWVDTNAYRGKVHEKAQVTTTMEEERRGQGGRHQDMFAGAKSHSQPGTPGNLHR